MGIYDFLQLKILFPVRALLLQRNRTVANLNPTNGAVITLHRLFHVSDILTPGDRSLTYLPRLDGRKPGLSLTMFYFCFD
jgi:hypothetical protein